MRDILEKSEKYANGGARKRLETRKFSEMEGALLQWFFQKRSQILIITVGLLIVKQIFQTHLPRAIDSCNDSSIITRFHTNT